MANFEIPSTLAALIGSAIGASAPVLSNLVSQRATTQRELLSRQMANREALYTEFIKAAAHLHVDSLANDTGDVESVVAIHALLARIRLLSSSAVVQAAEDFVLLVVQNYGQPSMTFNQMRADALTSKSDPLAGFSAACRLEFEKIGAFAYHP